MVRLIENTGQSPDEAIVILDAQTTSEGIAAEYSHLARLFGRQNVDWRLKRQALAQVAGRRYDVMMVEISPTDTRSIYFDITDFFGKG